MDTVSKEARSRIMAAVRRRGTSAERDVARALRAAGFTVKLNVKTLPGSPDVVVPAHRVAVFVHGCFWHRHGCRRTTTPTSNRSFWLTKFRRNKKRDRAAVAALEAKGWRVFVVWECLFARRHRARLASELAELAEAVKSRATACVLPRRRLRSRLPSHGPSS